MNDINEAYKTITIVDNDSWLMYGGIVYGNKKKHIEYIKKHYNLEKYEDSSRKICDCYFIDAESMGHCAEKRKCDKCTCNGDMIHCEIKHN